MQDNINENRAGHFTRRGKPFTVKRSAAAARDKKQYDYRRERNAHDYPVAPYRALQLFVLILVIKTLCHNDTSERSKSREIAVRVGELEGRVEPMILLYQAVAYQKVIVAQPVAVVGHHGVVPGNVDIVPLPAELHHIPHVVYSACSSDSADAFVSQGLREIHKRLGIPLAYSRSVDQRSVRLRLVIGIGVAVDCVVHKPIVDEFKLLIAVVELARLRENALSRTVEAPLRNAASAVIYLKISERSLSAAFRVSVGITAPEPQKLRVVVIERPVSVVYVVCRHIKIGKLADSAALFRTVEYPSVYLLLCRGEDVITPFYRVVIENARAGGRNVRYVLFGNAV